MNNKNTIVVTGFKPFGPYLINSSEVCVNMLRTLDLEKELGVLLVTEILDVAYDSALTRVNALWAEYHPFLVIHLGQHGNETIKIEKCARKNGYNKDDVQGQCPENNICPLAQEPVIKTTLDVSECHNLSKWPFVIMDSVDAGLYLCEFVYYISLAHDPSKALFIHIPCCSPHDAPKLKASVVADIIKAMYKQRLLKCNVI